jgi:hypothetical protein
MDLRCANGTLLGVLLPDGVLEVACRNRRCGKRPGVIVLHRFDVRTGTELPGSPKLYRDPEGGMNTNGST